MSLDRLIVFAAVAKHRNISRASKELHISQPAITKQIKLLEKEYSMTVFTRGGRGVRLTERGYAFLKDARKLIKRYEKLKEKFAPVTPKSSVQALTVGGSYSPSVALLPSLLARFQKTHPQAQLNLRTDDRVAIEEMILKGEVDLAVINNPPLNRHLTMEFYRSHPVVAFVAPNHPLVNRNRVNWENLKSVAFIVRKGLGGRGTGREYIQLLRKKGLTPKVAMQCDTPATAKEAVRRKMGVGILYRAVVADNIKRGEFKILNMPGETFEGKSYIIYHKNRPLTPIAQDFLKLLRKRAENN
jgi:DNA-binding transcriptional LysR family regulator